MKIIREFWEERSQEYGSKIEGVLPKSLPRPVNEYLHNWMLEQIKRVVEGREEAKILDLGCGYGRLSKEILDEFPKSRTFGIDVAQTYVNLYNQRLSPRGRAVKGDIRKLPFKDSSFDVVFMVATLMYLTKKAEQKAAVKELFRVLKPGGGFVIIERNSFGHSLVTLGGLVDRIRGGKYREIPAVSFGPEYLSSLIRENAARLDSTQGIPFWTLFLPLSTLLSLINQFLGRGFLALVSLLDKRFDWFLTPSLYISYSGRKEK